MDTIDDRSLVLDSIFYETPHHRILQGARLQIVPGAICGLFGRNGSGKSTLLKVAAGEIIPDSGLTIIDGERFPGRSLIRRFSRISWLPQDSMLPGDMRVNDLICSFPATSRTVSEDPVIHAFTGHRIRELSVGNRRYLEIRLLLSLDRTYVLLDEPFSGIDPNIIERITDLVTAAAKAGKGILLTDHYYRDTIPLVDDAYIMIDHRCVHLNPELDLKEQLLGYHYLSPQQQDQPH